MELEFDDVKKLRKSLLIASATGVFLAKLVKFSDGTIDFLGFSLPITDATFLPNYIGYLIIFFIVALIIRYNDDDFKKSYNEKLKLIANQPFPESYISFDTETTLARKRLVDDLKNQTKNRTFFTKYSVMILDIIFPIVLGVVSLAIIFLKL